MSTSRRPPRRQPVRSPQVARRPNTATTRTLEPPDYTREYAYIRKDLIMIAVIGGLLLAGMIVTSFII